MACGLRPCSTAKKLMGSVRNDSSKSKHGRKSLLTNIVHSLRFTISIVNIEKAWEKDYNINVIFVSDVNVLTYGLKSYF